MGGVKHVGFFFLCVTLEIKNAADQRLSELDASFFSELRMEIANEWAISLPLHSTE